MTAHPHDKSPFTKPYTIKASLCLGAKKYKTAPEAVPMTAA